MLRVRLCELQRVFTFTYTTALSYSIMCMFTNITHTKIIINSREKQKFLTIVYLFHKQFKLTRSLSLL